MKSILLASASILAFAGVATAQEVTTGVIFGGSAALGFNDATAGDIQGDDDESGFFYEADLSVTLRTILDNGLVAESTFGIPIADTNLGNELTVDNDFILGLSVDGMGALQLGDVAFAGEEFSFASMESADFSEQDSEVVLRGSSTLGGFTVAASALILDADGDEPGEGADDDFVDQISVGANGTIGAFSMSMGYQEESNISVRPDNAEEDDPLTVDIDESTQNDTEEGVFDTNNGDFNPDEQFGIAVGGVFAGVDAKVGYGMNMTDDTESYGVQLSYPFGPVTVSAEYVFEPDFEDNSYNVGVAYNAGNIILEANYGEEIGEEEYDLKAGYAFSEVTQVQLGTNDDDGYFIALRQGLGGGAFVEASYAEYDDAGFGNDTYADDIRLGATLRVGLEF